MHAPVLPGMFDGDPPVATTRKAVNVPSTSVSAYLERANPGARMTAVVGWLGAYGIEFCHRPTSAELARWGGSHLLADVSALERVLYVRRGLSDAAKKGLVEHAGKRICRVAGSMAITWRVRSR